MKYNRTEQKVLSAMAVATASSLVESREARVAFDDDRPVIGIVFDFTSICRSVGYMNRGRKVSDRNVSLALDSLVRKGDVVRHAPAMLRPTYKLNARLTDEADRRYNR